MENTQNPLVNPSPSIKPRSPRRDTARSVKEIVSTVALLLLAPLLAIILTAFVFQFYRVDGPSMQDTLHNNDRLIVYKLPKSLANLMNKPFMPDRGDIIVFSRADESTYNPTQPRQLIKRVIGMPGDRVVVKDGVVTVYNSENTFGFNPDANTEYQKNAEPTSGNLDTNVGANQVFVMGDNRSNSLDSRVFGPIPTEDIVGKLVLRVLPFESVQ